MGGNSSRELETEADFDRIHKVSFYKMNTMQTHTQKLVDYEVSDNDIGILDRQPQGSNNVMMYSS